MEILNQQTPRSFRVEDIFLEPTERQPEVLVRYPSQQWGETFEAKSDSFTIVMNRDLKGSIQMASAMAIFLSKKHPLKNVLLVNTYAGVDLMQRTLALGMKDAELPMPSSFARLPIFDDSVASPFPFNLRLLDCPMATCTTWRLEQEIQLYPSDIVILNSFEFASLSQWQRGQLAEGLLELRAKFGLTIVIFSQEMRSDISPYFKGRGALGILSAHAPSVWRIMTAAEQEKWDNLRRRGIVH
jgi:hypothetical protein